MVTGNGNKVWSNIFNNLMTDLRFAALNKYLRASWQNVRLKHFAMLH